ncbi:hypothetical protein Tco_0200482 [Tanacetum coccineum]
MSRTQVPHVSHGHGTSMTRWFLQQTLWQGYYPQVLDYTCLRDGDQHSVADNAKCYTALSNNIHRGIMPETYSRCLSHLQDDDIMKNIFNSGRNKNKVGMQIPAWMITDEMKLTGTHRTLSTPRQSARLTPPVPVPTAEKADEMILQDMLQVSLAEQKSHEEQEARENVALVYEHLAAEEIEKLVEESENVDDSSPPRHDETFFHLAMVLPRSDKESPEVEIVQEKEEETTKDTEVEPNIVIPVNVDDEEDEITDEVFELRRRAKGKNRKLQELTVTHPTPSSGSFAPKLTKTNRLLSLIKAKPNRFKRYKTFFHELQGRYGYLFAHLKKRFMPRTSSDQLADNLHDVMMETLLRCEREIKVEVKKGSSCENYMSGHILHVHPAQVQSSSVPEQQHQLPSAVRTRDQDDPHDDCPIMRGRTSAKMQKTSEYDAYVSGEASKTGTEFLMLKIFYISRHEETGRPKEEIYSNSKIVQSVQVIKTYWELGHEHKFITEIVARRANDYIVLITEPDYKNLNKNDIEDIYLLIMNGKVPDYADTGLLWSLSVFIRSSVIWERVYDFQLRIKSYQQKVNLTAPIITFPGIEEYEVFSIVYEPVHGIIYKNSKKDKRVMRYSEIHKFCDATPMRVLEGLKSYNNDVKYGYVQKELTSDEVEYLKLFEKEIKICWVEERIVEGSIEGSVVHIQGVRIAIIRPSGAINSSGLGFLNLNRMVSTGQTYHSKAVEFANFSMWACSLEDQQHHHIDKDGYVGSTSPRADKWVATLDEIMAASKSGQCAIVDMDVKPGNRPSPIKIIGNVHKRQKELVMRSHLLLARSQLQGEFTMKQGKEVTATGGYKIGHNSMKKKAMINDKANEIWRDLL